MLNILWRPFYNIGWDQLGESQISIDFFLIPWEIYWVKRAIGLDKRDVEHRNTFGCMDRG